MVHLDLSTTFNSFGILLIGVVLLLTSRRFMEKKIDRQTFNELRREQIMVIIGLIFVILGYIFDFLTFLG